MSKVDTTTKKKNLEGKALPIILFTVFLDVLGVGILIPVIPQLIFTIFQPAGYSMNTSLILLGWLSTNAVPLNTNTGSTFGPIW